MTITIEELQELEALRDARDELSDAINWIASLHPMASRERRLHRYRRAHKAIVDLLRKKLAPVSVEDSARLEWQRYDLWFFLL